MSSAAAESDCEDIAEAFAGKGLEDSMAERAPRVRQCQLEPLLYSAVGGYCAENANRRITLDISDWLHVRDLWRNSARPNTDTQFTLTRNPMPIPGWPLRRRSVLHIVHTVSRATDAISISAPHCTTSWMCEDGHGILRKKEYTEQQSRVHRI